MSLELFLSLVPALTCVVAISAICFSSKQFRLTQESAREAQVIELFIKFNQLNIEQNFSTNPESDHWYGNSKFAITEFIYKYSTKMKSAEEWITTVKWMLSQQDAFIKGGSFNIETYSKEFRDFCKVNGCELKP